MTNETSAVVVSLAKQLRCATDINACFCIGCGQPDEPELHDRARCPGTGGVLDTLTVADALEAYDESCEREPDLDDEARALHCAIVAVEQFKARLTSTPQAAAAEVREAKAVLLAFNGGLVRVDDDSNPRGYVTYYRPLDAMRAALAAVPAHAPSAGEGVERAKCVLESKLNGVWSWLSSISECDLTDIVADGGITAGMVVQQEARDQMSRVQAIIEQVNRFPQIRPAAAPTGNADAESGS